MGRSGKAEPGGVGSSHTTALEVHRKKKL